MDRIRLEEDTNVVALFYDDLADAHPTVEQLAVALESDCANEHTRDELVRIFQHLMQRAVSCEFGPAVEPLEVMSRVLGQRESGPCIPAFAQTLLLVMDKLLTITRQVVDSGTLDFEAFGNIQSAITPLARVSTAAGWEPAVREATQRLMGEFVAPDTALDGVDFFFDDVDIYVAPKEPIESRPHGAFYTLGTMMDRRHHFWHGRSDYLVPMALGMNGLAGNPVDMEQLLAAVYLHDAGMLALSDEILYSKQLGDAQRAEMREHSLVAYELALSLDDERERWRECARIVYQHHERPDGRGYPEGLSGHSICDGAKILSICDAFYAMTHAQPHKPNRRSILRAVAEINACAGTQFDAQWVSHFNTVVKTERAAGSI